MKTSHKKVLFKQKIALILFGLFLSFVLLEAGLRLGGFIFLSIQEYRNLQSIKQKGTYHILCLGESTTQGQYPQFLEQVLNQSNIGMRFSVIDKGVAGTNTPVILSKVESYLNEYHPEMVVAMMGCNDGGIMYYQDIYESDTWLFKHCRVYRFGWIIYMHIFKKLKQESILRAAKLNPNKDIVCVDLGQAYCKQGKFSDAEYSYKKAIELNPKNEAAYVGLGWIYLKQGKFSDAEYSYKKAIEISPKNDRAYVELGWIYLNQGKFSDAEDSFKKAIELNPNNDKACAGLGWTYRYQGKFSDAEDLYKKAIELNPNNGNAYIELGWIYLKQGKFSDAEDSYGRAIEFHSKNDRICGAISALYTEMGKSELAKEYAQKADRLRLEYRNLATGKNYRKLKNILDKRGIKLVCVQYPMRNVESLKKIFAQDEGIIFVDNESAFKEALNQASYGEYFVDMFGGDFGHCTKKGNRFLAKNIANTILKRVFRYSPRPQKIIREED